MGSPMGPPAAFGHPRMKPAADKGAGLFACRMAQPVRGCGCQSDAPNMMLFHACSCRCWMLARDRIESDVCFAVAADRQVGECVVILKNFNGGKDVNWPAAKSMMADTNFLRSLVEFDKDSLSDKQIKKVKEYLKDPRQALGHR